MGELFRSIELAIGWLLALFYDIIPLFGMSIILLTLTINLVLFPLTLKQTRSTRAFQAVAPEIKRIQKEYKDDPEAMQKEMMRVQKEAGATPGGCLGPILVQMPVWFALFRVLRNVADISNGTTSDVLIPADSALLEAVRAGRQMFLGMDLSQVMSVGIKASPLVALPYVLMIVLMIATQYYQMWHAQRGTNTSNQDLTPQQRQQQQTQQAITRFMPMMIGVFSWNFPAGLVLYWTTSNLFRLAQQFVIFAIDGRPPAPGGEVGGGKNGSKEEPGSEAVSTKKPHPVSSKKQQRRKRR